MLICFVLQFYPLRHVTDFPRSHCIFAWDGKNIELNIIMTLSCPLISHYICINAQNTWCTYLIKYLVNDAYFIFRRKLCHTLVTLTTWELCGDWLKGRFYHLFNQWESGLEQKYVSAVIVVDAMLLKPYQVFIKVETFAEDYSNSTFINVTILMLIKGACSNPQPYHPTFLKTYMWCNQVK